MWAQVHVLKEVTSDTFSGNFEWNWQIRMEVGVLD